MDKDMDKDMDKEVKAAIVQGRYTLFAAVIAGIFSLFSIISSGKAGDLSKQFDEVKSELRECQNSYNELQELYSDIENKYNTLSEQVKEKTITVQKWIDQMDIYYQEGMNINGSRSEGWTKTWDQSTHKDSQGNKHEHGICVRGYREDTYILDYILLDDVYIGFKGLFTLEYESRNTKIESNLKIYSIDDEGESELLYQIQNPLKGGVLPKPFDFKINGSNHIRIEISSGSGEEGEFLLALVDACFYK